MINVHKLNTRSADIPLPYDTPIRLSVEEAIKVLENPNNVIVAFRDIFDEYTVLFLKNGEVHGMYHEYYRKIVSSPKTTNDVELNLLDVELLGKIKASRNSQSAHPEGWLRFFTDPAGIGLSHLRVYDVSYKVRTTTLHLKD